MPYGKGSEARGKKKVIKELGVSWGQSKYSEEIKGQHIKNQSSMNRILEF